jgi:putative thioredoxin
MGKANVVDVDDASFETEVIERSRQVPVVVDFWAPWCGPCRVLGPLLEAETERRAGEAVLAKVNVDQAQGLAAAFRVQGIPAVKAFRDGRVVAELVGAVPAREVQAFFDRLLPSAAERLAAEAGQLLAEGRRDEAEQRVSAALAQDPRSGAALTLLAALRAEAGQSEEALGILDRLPPDHARAPEALRLRAQLRLQLEAGSVGAEPELRARLEADAGDLEARYGVALYAAAAGRYPEALDGLLECVRRDRAWREEAARKAMLDLFELIGPRSELAEDYRGRLAMILY